MSGPVVVCAGVGVRYGPVDALAAVDLEVGAGELVAVLGPSGSGKTTLLHAIAGFAPLTAGSIEIDGTMVATRHTSVAPEDRHVGVVFQHHALWPHLTAAQTVAFPLRRSGASGQEIDAEVDRLLERLGLSHLGSRVPAELSGGEQQRVSLARALARHPTVFLFDEPTAHLDAPRRRALLDEIDQQRRVDESAGIYATHDAAEALALADRVLILRDGHTVQIGTPLEVYEQPIDVWAAELTGPASVLDVTLVPTRQGWGRLAVGQAQRDIECTGEPGGTPLLRPEWVRLGGPFAGRVDRVWYRGSRTEYRLQTPGGSLMVGEDGPPRLTAGDETGWDVHRAHLVSPR